MIAHEGEPAQQSNYYVTSILSDPMLIVINACEFSMLTTFSAVIGVLNRRFRLWQATLAACNVAARLSGHPVWTDMDVLPFVDGPVDDVPKASPSIVNAEDLGLKKLE